MKYFKWLGIGTLALALCLVCFGASAQTWQEAYLTQLSGSDAKRVAALVSLSGSDAPELAQITVDASGTASLRVYGFRSGKVFKYDCQNYDLDGFALQGLRSVRMQLRQSAQGSPCLHITLSGAERAVWMAFTSSAQGKLSPVIRAAKSGTTYQVNGETVTSARYETLLRQYNAAYVKRGGALPVRTIAKSAGRAAIKTRFSALCKKYQAFSTLKGIKLTPASLSLVPGATSAVTLSRSPASAISESAAWRSSDTSVARVDDSGTVTAVASGSAVITATAGGLSKSCRVTVAGGASSQPTGLTLSPTSATLVKGEALTITATPLPLGVSAQVRWSSSKPQIASVDQSGRVLALSRGTCVITAKTANGKSAKCKLVVNNTAAVIVDISQHNDASKMDWAKIAKNVDLLILRCGVTRTQTKPLGIGKDDNFALYAEKCRQYDIPFGVYYYGKCSSVAQAREEARFTWEIASPVNPLFYVYDAEEACLSKAKIEAYMTTLQELGAKKTGYYIAHHRYAAYNLDVSLVDFIWLPHYGDNNGKVNSTPSYACDMHQYTSKGTVPGIGGYVDLNRLMGGKSLAWFTGK